MNVSGEILRGRVTGRRVLLMCGVLLAAAWSPAASMASGWSSTGATLPANAAPNPVVSLGSVSCGSAGDCGAVGFYVDSAGHQEGLLATETAGTWQPAVQAGTPMPAAANPFVTVGSVSCPAAGSCSAVGEYQDSSNYRQGLLLTETAGAWQSPGITATLPTDAVPDASVTLPSVSCAATGECAAVGSYDATGSNVRGLLLTKTAGVWGTGVAAIAPAGADPIEYLTLSSVSCPSAGNCSAVGRYRDSSGHSQGVLLTETAGNWQPGIKVSLPANAASSPFVTLTSVSCAAAGECSAVGAYADTTGNTQGLLVTETGGVWQSSVEASLPADALGSGQIVDLGSVSCGSAGDCSAVGTYTDSSNYTQGLLVTRTPGGWQPAIKATLPANAQSYQRVRLGSVSCVASGECTAVGSYADSSSDTQEMWLTETSGSWAAGVEAPPPANSRSDPNILLSSVSCASAQGGCNAVGNYTDGTAARQGLLVSPLASPALSLSAPSSGVAGAPVSAASISASLSAGSSPAGTVTFSVYGPQSTPPSSCTSGGTIVGTAAASGDGTYHPSGGFTPVSAGDYWWYASYAGDTRNSPAASGCGAAMAETAVVTPAPAPNGGPPGPTATSGLLRSSSDPSVSGQRVIYTATISPAPDGGTVRFDSGGQALAGCAAVPVDPAHGTAICATTYPRPAAYQVQADYSGDARFSASRSTGLTQTVRSSVALVRRPSARAGKISFTVSCARGSGGCLINAVLSTSQTVRSHHGGHTKVMTRVVGVGTKTMRIAAGKTITVTIKLNPAGRKLLAALKRLRVKLALSLVVGKAHIPVSARALVVTLSVPRPHHRG